MLLWLGLETDCSFVLLGSAFLLPMTRAIGVFCLVPIAWHFLWNQSLLTSAATGYKQALRASPFILMPLMGWGVYFILMDAWTGNPFEGMQAQRFWGVQSIHNIFDLPKFISSYLSPTAFHELRGSLLDRIVFAGVCYTVPLVWKLGKDLFLWLLVLAFLPALSGDLASFTRFCAVAFPVYAALGWLTVQVVGRASRLPPGRPALEATDAAAVPGMAGETPAPLPERLLLWYGSTTARKWLALGYFGICGPLHLVLLWRFVNYHWAG